MLSFIFYDGMSDLGLLGLGRLQSFVVEPLAFGILRCFLHLALLGFRLGCQQICVTRANYPLQVFIGKPAMIIEAQARH